MSKIDFDFPKIDLHLHLDGSISPEVVLNLAKKDCINLPVYQLDELKKLMVVPDNCKDLTEYLSRFELPLKVMQTPSGLYDTTYELICRLAGQGLVYAEIRFAPQLHLQKGLAMEAVVRYVLDAVDKAALDFPFIKVRLILCAMRGEGAENRRLNLETVDTAEKFLDRGVAAIDLAGAEALFPTHCFDYVFERAQKLDVPYTIHSGEVGNAQSEYEAIKFGAHRFGHGIATADSEELKQIVYNQCITLECCPTSNLHTKIVSSIDRHPIRAMFDAGLNVTVNTDNMTVSDTTLDKEYSLLMRGLGFTRKELIEMNINSAKAAFLPENEKEELIRKLKAAL